MLARNTAPKNGTDTPPAHAKLEYLASLGPEAQGDIDESLLRENLTLTPIERLAAAGEAATQVERLRQAMISAGHA